MKRELSAKQAAYLASERRWHLSGAAKSRPPRRTSRDYDACAACGNRCRRRARRTCASPATSFARRRGSVRPPSRSRRCATSPAMCRRRARSRWRCSTRCIRRSGGSAYEARSHDRLSGDRLLRVARDSVLGARVDNPGADRARAPRRAACIWRPLPRCRRLIRRGARAPAWRLPRHHGRMDRPPMNTYTPEMSDDAWVARMAASASRHGENITSLGRAGSRA
jgi:hypothetical protein